MQARKMVSKIRKECTCSVCSQVRCNMWQCAMKCDGFEGKTQTMCSVIPWATRVRAVSAWQCGCMHLDNCDNRLGQARWQTVHEKNVCADGVLFAPAVDCQEIKFPASEKSLILELLKNKFTVHTRMKIPMSPSSTLTSSRCLVAIVMTKMKTNALWKKDSVAIL